MSIRAIRRHVLAFGALCASLALPATLLAQEIETAVEQPLSGETPRERDSDGDGMSDRLERATGTAPLRADSDGDGVRDSDEDTDRDGRVDPGESDPRRAGLFPGGSPHIPEPMNFDLVRGLGARSGEIETNVLIVTRPRRGGFGVTTWAPEVEWAIADDFAVEVELPMADREVEALKAAAQWTAPSPIEHFTHGVQVLGEYLLDARHPEISALYLAGGRLGPVSLFGMVGMRTTIERESHQEVLVNPSAFVDVDEAVTLGVEGNLAFGLDGETRGLALGQVHWQVVRRFRVQVGGGTEVVHGRAGALLVSRLILE